jgi:hypothetical protein
MGAKTRRVTILEVVLLHSAASKRLRDMCEEVERLRDAGKRREALRVLSAADELLGQIEALEAQYRRH